MAALTSTTPTLTGPLFGAVSAAGGGDTFTNTGTECFYIKNGGGSPITVTFDSPGTCDFAVAANSNHDVTVSVAAGAEKLIGPFPVSRFNTGANVSVTYSGVTSVTVAVIKPA